MRVGEQAEEGRSSFGSNVGGTSPETVGTTSGPTAGGQMREMLHDA